MKAISEMVLIGQLRDLLREIFSSEPKFLPGSDGRDTIAHVLSFKFAVEVKDSAGANSIKRGIDQLLRRLRIDDSGDIPLLVVPHMSKRGKEQCRSSNISWIDLSGNANICDRALIVKIEGKPNQFKERGRPRNPFAPKSSRLVRILLSDPFNRFFQKDLAKQANLSKAMVSQVISSLEKDGHVERKDHAISLKEPGLLFAEWKERYSLSSHSITKGHVYSESGSNMVMRLGKKLSQMKIEYAFTGLAAAWNHAPFSAFRITSVYLRNLPSPFDVEELEFKPEPRGANVWLIIPNDEGVFYDSRDSNGLHFVSPLQTYLDLESHPERSREAQAEIRSQHLKWSIDT